MVLTCMSSEKTGCPVFKFTAETASNGSLKVDFDFSLNKNMYRDQCKMANSYTV